MQIGIRGTYQGLTATVIKQGSNQAIRFFVYNNLKLWLQEGDNTKEIGMIKTFMIGGVAGAASVFGNTPVDVIKTRMQVDYIYFHLLCWSGLILYFPWEIFILTMTFIVSIYYIKMLKMSFIFFVMFSRVLKPADTKTRGIV